VQAVIIPTYHLTPRWSVAPHTDTNPEPVVGVTKQLDTGTGRESDYLEAVLAITAPTGERMFHKFTCVVSAVAELSHIERRVVAYSLRKIGPGVWTVGPAINAFGADGVPPLNAFVTITDVPEPAPFEKNLIRL
jgi:hypothetical protein